MQDQEPTVRSWEIGLVLAKKLDEIGMSQSELASQLEWSPSMVSRMITGKRPVSAELMSGVLGVLRITGRARRALMDMARRAAERGWWQDFGDRLPLDLASLSAREDCATAITVFETNYPPPTATDPRLHDRRDESNAGDPRR